MPKSLETQVGGDHYKDNGVQPLEATLANFGYEGLRASVYTKVLKYLTRDKGSHIEDIKKAIHCLEIQLEAAQTEENSTALSEKWSENFYEELGRYCSQGDVTTKTIEDSEGWITNTGVDPKLGEGKYAIKYGDGGIREDCPDSNMFDWRISLVPICRIDYYRIIKNTGDNKVDG